MWRKKQLNILISQNLDLFIKQSNFPRNALPDLIKLLRLSPYSTLKPSIQSHHKIMECVKWLILLHNLMLGQTKTQPNQIAQLIQMINAQSESNTTFQTILLQKMIIPYKAYLLKRNSFTLRDIDSQFHCFLLINLIKKALSFTNILFTLGRYLLKSNNFLVEFNLVLAKDLSFLYRTMQLKMDEGFRNSNSQVLQALNQSMYSVFYNCYFNKSVSRYAPDWIQTDTIKPKSAKQIRNQLVSPKIEFRTQKLLETLHTEGESEVSITIEETSMTHFKHHMRSISTISTNRQSDYSDDAESQKRERENRERKEFITLAESILQAFKEEQVDDQCN